MSNKLECLIHKNVWLNTKTNEVWFFSAQLFMVEQMPNSQLILFRGDPNSGITKLPAYPYDLMQCDKNTGIVKYNEDVFSFEIKESITPQLLLKKDYLQDILFEIYPKRV